LDFFHFSSQNFLAKKIKNSGGKMLRENVSRYFAAMQQNLFPGFKEELGTTTNKHLQVIVALDVLEIERFIPYQSMFAVGRPPVNRDAMARAFVAKAVLNLPTTESLIDRLKVDAVLRRICGFGSRVPSSGTFSNCFGYFSKLGITDKVHECLISEVYKEKIVGHVSRDSTAIEGREKPIKTSKIDSDESTNAPSPKKKGRPKKGEEKQAKEATRIERQGTMSVPEMLADLPKRCDVGGKKNSKGNQEWWVGFKLHMDVDDHGIPLTALVTSASMHDSQAAIPLEKLTNSRVTSLYSLMDAAYNSAQIEQAVTNAGKVSIIDPKKPRNGEKIKLEPAKAERYKIRTTVERTNSAIKDDFGGRNIRVRGHAKVSTHLMFGVLAMSALRIADVFC